MTVELTDCVYALRKRVEDLEERMDQKDVLGSLASIGFPEPEVTDVRAAVRTAVHAVYDAWNEQYATQFADDLLAWLNRAGWRLIKKGEGDL